MVSSKHKFKHEFKRVATENNVRQRSKDIYKSLNVINQEIQARGHQLKCLKAARAFGLYCALGLYIGMHLLPTGILVMAKKKR